MAIRDILLVCTLIFSGCTQPQTVREVHSQARNHPPSGYHVVPGQTEGTLELFTFQAVNSLPKVWGSRTFSVIGKAFIANKKIWTARHLFYNAPIGTDDSLLLGDSPIFGLLLCPHEHEKGSWFFYKTERGILRFVTMGQNDLHFSGTLDRPMMQGDSGSPVTCSEHNAVIGIVSYFYPDQHSFKDIRFAGCVAKIKNNGRDQILGWTHTTKKEDNEKEKEEIK
jgi:hypothetical protein